MTRARGRRLSERDVPPVVDDEDPEARDVGASSRTQGVPSAIPGGRPHLTNAPTVRHSVPVPDSKPEVRGTNAHGVLPDSHTTRERAEFMRGPNDLKPLVPIYRPPVPHEPVVPVRIVQTSSPKIRASTGRHFVVNAQGTEPVRLCGIDPNRVAIMILNEDANSHVRMAKLPGDLVGGAGAILPKAATTYTRIDTQDEWWAVSADTGTPIVSVIQIFDKFEFE